MPIVADEPQLTPPPAGETGVIRLELAGVPVLIGRGAEVPVVESVIRTLCSPR